MLRGIKAYMGKILIVDDDAPTSRVLGLLLRRAGHETIGVLEPSAALDAVRDSAPDLVILDMHMPGMSGIEVLEQIKSNPATAEIPVVIFSAAEDAAAERLARGLGACDFWLKAATAFDSIESRVNACLQG